MRQNMDYVLREMTIGDYDDIWRLWEQAEGLSLEESDTRKAIAIYLNRNRGLCFVACVGDEIVGTVLCGHDGRRGILRHLAVKKEFRRRGIARADQRIPFSPREGRDREMQHICLGYEC